MTSHLDVLLFLEAATVVLAGGIIIYTTKVHGATVLYPRAAFLLGGALAAAGAGAMLLLTPVPGGYTYMLGFASVAGVGFCLAGWKLTSGLVRSEQFVDIDPRATEDSSGFGGAR